MRIKVFGGLKDYLEPEMVIHLPFGTIQEVENYLQKEKPAVCTLLAKCRYAVNNRFVGKDHILEKEDEVFVMPPSSGG